MSRDDDIHLLTGAYALDALSDDERAFFDRHLETCEVCRHEVAAHAETIAALGAGLAEEPPASLRTSVLDQVASTPQVATSTPHAAPMESPTAQQRTGGARRRWLAPVAAALAIVAVGLTASTVVLWQENAELAETTVAQAELNDLLRTGALVELEGEAEGTARFVWDDGRDEGVLLADGLEPPAEGMTYQLWLIRDDEPDPAGLFDAPGGQVTFTADGAVRDAEAVAITIEPDGGSPAPTGDILYLAEL